MLELRNSLLKPLIMAYILFIVLLPKVAFANNDSAQGLQIVTTIKPLYLLAKELASPKDSVELLLPTNSSPHHYQLSVSDRKRLSTADIVVWVGSELESFLSKTLSNTKGKVFTISELSDINWPEAAHIHEGHGGHQHDRDPHMWLDPYNLSIVAKALSVELSQLAPNNAAVYALNRDNIQRALATLDDDLQARLSKVADTPFIVMHPAYGHLVERYALNQREFILLTPERGIGARHLYQLKSIKAKCVFGEVGQKDKLVNKVAGYTNAKVAILDPLGFNLSNEAPTTSVISALANTMIECLSS